MLKKSDRDIRLFRQHPFKELPSQNPQSLLDPCLIHTTLKSWIHGIKKTTAYITENMKMTRDRIHARKHLKNRSLHTTTHIPNDHNRFSNPTPKTLQVRDHLIRRFTRNRRSKQSYPTPAIFHQKCSRTPFRCR